MDSILCKTCGQEPRKQYPNGYRSDHCDGCSIEGMSANLAEGLYSTMLSIQADRGLN